MRLASIPFSWAPIQSRRPNNLQLVRKSCGSNAVLNSFSFRVVCVWNSLSQNIVDAPNPTVFAHRLRNFDLCSVVRHGSFIV